MSYRRNRHLNLWGATVAITILIVIAVNGIMLMYESNRHQYSHIDKDEKWTECLNRRLDLWKRQDSVLKALDSDTAAASGRVTREDIVALSECQQLLMQRQDSLVDDIRQETNNTINKVNGWLGFWVALLAIVGGLAPLYFQFRQDKDFRRLQEELERKDAEIKDQINRRFKNMELSVLAHHLRTIQTVFDNPQIADTARRNELIEANWNESRQKLKNLIFLYTANTDTGVNHTGSNPDARITRNDLADAMVAFGSIAQNAVQYCSRKDMRALNRFADTLRETVDLLAGNTASGKEIRESLQRTTDTLDQVTLRLKEGA